MSFTFKGYKQGQKTRATANSPAQKAQSTAAPTVKAGSKNSNGPKGGSGKTSTPANRTYKKDYNTTKSKVAKITKAKLNTTPYYQAGSHIDIPKGNAQISATKGVNNITNNAGRKNRSTRVNYRQLRSK